MGEVGISYKTLAQTVLSLSVSGLKYYFSLLEAVHVFCDIMENLVVHQDERAVSFCVESISR